MNRFEKILTFNKKYLHNKRNKFTEIWAHQFQIASIEVLYIPYVIKFIDFYI